MIERDETRERFLVAIAERIDTDAIAKAHLFPPIRQGGVESGVAVIAVSEPGEEAEPDEKAEPDERAEPDEEARARRTKAARLVVYTAKYRLTLKGPERGKWAFAMHAEGDAPLLTVDKVVRGVQQRSGDAEEPTKVSAEEFRALLLAARSS